MEAVAKVKSLQKALDVLGCFSPQVPELGVSEIARMLGLHKSNVYNILSTLELSGYVRQNQLSGKYLLGNKMVEFSFTVMSSYKYTNTLLPVMNELSTDLKTVVYFGILHGESVLYLFSTYPPPAFGYAKNMPYRSILGEKAPLYCTAVGKALLMPMGDAEVRALLPAHRERYTPNTLMTDEETLADLARARERGYTVDDMEHEPNVRCAGVPVFDRNMAVVGALSASGPTSLVTPQSLEAVSAKLISAAFEIRHHL